MKRQWKKFRHRLEWLGLALLTGIVPRVPRRVIAGLARGLGRVAYRLDVRGRRLALANIEAAFGARYAPAQRVEIVRASFQNFARTMLDLFWSPALTPQNYQRYIKIENAEVLKKIQAAQEGAVLVCIHHGNFEWASMAIGFEGIPVMIVTERFKNPRLSERFKRCREVSGHRIIAQESSMIRLLKHVKRGGVAGMLVDLNLRPHEAATIIDTFGLKMCVTYLQAVLAERGPAQLVPVESVSQPDGTCRVIIHEPLKIHPEATRQQIAQQCWDYFAPTISAQPHLWLWAYRHWRYKPQFTTATYPFYAHESPAFNQLDSDLKIPLESAVRP